MTLMMIAVATHCVTQGTCGVHAGACMTQSKSHMDFCDLDSGFLDLDSGPESQETAVNVQDGVFWILDSDFLDLDLGPQNARLNFQTWIWILRSGL